MAMFLVAGHRTLVRAARVGRLIVSLEAGTAAYSCSVAGRRIGAGSLRATAPQTTPTHRFAVREVNGFGEFYDRTTGAKFVPRGSNYIRLAPQVDTFGRTHVYHSTFIVGVYEPARADAALQRMAASGYNVVRVFLNDTCARGCIANMATGQIAPAYVANLVDFLRRARAHGISAMLTAEWLPSGAAYDAIAQGIRTDWFEDINTVFLSPQGVEMSVLFWQSLVRELIRQGAPLDAIFAYSLWNEAFVDSAHRPFTPLSGPVTTANGMTYDVETDRRRMIDDAFVYYIDRVRTAILELDPTALVTMGFFEPKEPNPSRRGDPRLVRTAGVIERSTADFVDIHGYPGGSLDLPQLMQNFGIVGPTRKPIVLGEMGAFRNAFGTVDDAAAALVAWQRSSCPYGIDGWLLWTWDTDAEQPELWSAVSNGGTLERALSPEARPDACS